jgi:hypothetical protein
MLNWRAPSTFWCSILAEGIQSTSISTSSSNPSIITSALPSSVSELWNTFYYY